MRPPESLDADALSEALPAGFDASRVRLIPVVGSTNDEIRRLAEGGAPSGIVVAAGGQTDGRGRLGRSWISPPGLGLYVSVLRRTRRPADELGRFGLAAVAAAWESCRETSGAPVGIKWPNDLTSRDRKLAGILAESWGRPGAISIAVGAGINVSHAHESFSPSLASAATSLAIESPDRYPTRERLLAEFLVRFDDLSDRLEAGDWSAVRVRWESGAGRLAGRRVAWARPGGSTVEARVLGLTDRGALAVLCDDGARGDALQGESVRWLE